MTEAEAHVLEEKNMEIKLLEREIKELTKQNYNLMVRISELGDELRTLRGSKAARGGLDSFSEL